MYNRLAEWSSKEIWLAWPFDQELWCEHLKLAQEEVLALLKAMSNERVRLVVPTEAEHKKVRGLVPSFVAITVMPYGDIWFRDTMPLVVEGLSKKALVQPKFNGWGSKYLFDDDITLSSRVIDAWGMEAVHTNLVFEGGAVECDGEGCLLTTEQCLLNDNRNPGRSKFEIEQELYRLFGSEKIIWIKEGLKNDHTDGHIDTIARFIAPHTVAIMAPEKGDPNFAIMMDIKHQLSGQTDALGRALKIVELPSPGAILNSEGEVMPASYLNFIIGDHGIYMPTYGSGHDEAAIDALQKVSNLKVIGLSGRAILSGGGAFHCMSQELFQ